MVESEKPSVLRRWLGRLGGGVPEADKERRLPLANAGIGPWDWTGGRAFRPDSDDIVFDVTIFAARLASRDGWVIDQAVLPPEEIERRLAADADVAGVAILGAARGQGRDAEGFAKPFAPAAYTAIHHDWAYDQAAGCWRAPDEPLAAFPWPAERTDALVLALGATSWGWMPVALAAGERTVAFQADCGACPFARLVAWLETVVAREEAAGGAGRFDTLHGVTHVEFHAFPAEVPERVRVAVVLHEGVEAPERRVALDIDIGRQALVLALYGAMQVYAAGPDYRPFAWAGIALGDELAARFPGVTGADLVGLDAGRLERLAQKIGGRHGIGADHAGGDGGALLAWIDDAATAGPPAADHGEEGEPVDLPAAWGGWRAEQRLAWLPNFLDAEVSHWIGNDLRHLRSDRLERFLGD